jgi:hypothetical protein
MVIRAGGMEFDTVEEVQKAMDKGLIQKHDVVGTSPGMQVPHGIAYNQNIGGLFTRPGADPDMFGTIVVPTGAQLLAELFMGVNIYTDPEYDVLSGVKALVGTTAVNGCSPAPKAGDAKLCTLRAKFGEAYIETDQGQLNKAGGYINLADTDRRLLNLAGMNNPLMPEPMRAAQNINTPLGLAYMRLYVSIIREFMRVLFTGNYGSSSGIWTKEFNGFDQLIIENPTDVEGNICTAASAKVFNWNNQPVNGSVGGASLVDIMTALLHYVTRLQEDTELPAQGVLVMHNDLFYALTAIWPCSYLTNQCNVVNTATSSSTQFVSGKEQTDMRDEMRSGSFLWANGQRIPVVQSTGISQTAFGAGFSTSIYFIPMYALGKKVTYIEGFDQNNPAIRQILEAGAYTHYRAFNGGFYAMTERQTDFCWEHKYSLQPRLIMRTPWLAFRIQNVNYTMPGFLYSRDWNPSGAYHANGGRYYNNPPYYNPNSI